MWFPITFQGVGVEERGSYGVIFYLHVYSFYLARCELRKKMPERYNEHLYAFHLHSACNPLATFVIVLCDSLHIKELLQQ